MPLGGAKAHGNDIGLGWEAPPPGFKRMVGSGGRGLREKGAKARPYGEAREGTGQPAPAQSGLIAPTKSALAVKVKRCQRGPGAEGAGART